MSIDLLKEGIKTMNHQYICKSCGKHITLPNESKYCPICSGKVESKAEIYAKEKTKELQELLPILESKYNAFAELYTQFKKTNETLRVYAARGLVDRDSVPDFKPEGLTDIFYKSRRKRNKKSGNRPPAENQPIWREEDEH